MLLRVAGEGGVNQHGRALVGKKLRVTLGTYPAMSLHAARAKASDLIEQAKRDVNPKTALRANATAGGPTVEALSEDFVKHHVHSRPPHEDAVVHERSQPYIKLHGSSNWRDTRDSRIWVMGTNKRVTLGHFLFLTKLHDLFRQYLSNGPVRLMVIGYSINDKHINEMIMCGAERGQIQLCIIDPLGIGVLDKNASHAIYSEHQLLQRLKSHVIGASRRTLSEIFGSDHVEHRKVMSFFPPEWRPRDRPWPNIGV